MVETTRVAGALDVSTNGCDATDAIVINQAVHHKQRPRMPIELDAVVVWRIVRGRIAEAWDIPSVHAVRPQMP